MVLASYWNCKVEMAFCDFELLSIVLLNIIEALLFRIHVYGFIQLVNDSGGVNITLEMVSNHPWLIGRGLALLAKSWTFLMLDGCIERQGVTLGILGL